MKTIIEEIMDYRERIIKSSDAECQHSLEDSMHMLIINNAPNMTKEELQKAKDFVLKNMGSDKLKLLEYEISR